MLAHAYENRLLAGMTPVQFLRIRLIRLYPLYFIGTLIGLPLAIASGSLDWSKPIASLSVLSALAFLPDPSFQGPAYPLNIPAWSLFFELAANAAYAIGIRSFTNKRLILMVLLSLAIMAAFHDNVDIGPLWKNFIGGFPRVTFGFFAGVLTYRIWRTAKWRPSFPQWAAQGLVMVLLLCLAFPQRSSWGDRFDFLALLLFPLIIYCGACREPSPRSRALFLWFGSISYALYITHSPLIQTARFLSLSVFQVPMAAAAPWAGLGAGAVTLILAAVLSSIDPALRDFLMGRRKRVAATAARNLPLLEDKPQPPPR